MSKKSKAPRRGAKAAAGAPLEVHVLRARAIGDAQETFSHPWNPNSEIIGVRLGRALGLARVAVSIVRVPAGKESFVPHAHWREEEWIYVLAGEGLARIGDDETMIGAGDFLAFPAPQPVHHLKNAGADDLVYLMGGERLDADVVDFPDHGKRSVRIGEEVTIYETGDGARLAVPETQKSKNGKSKPQKAKKKKKS